MNNPVVKTIIWVLKSVTFVVLAFIGAVILGITVWSFLDWLPDIVSIPVGLLILTILGFWDIVKDRYEEFKEEEI